jgi:hypothetical protein
MYPLSSSMFIFHEVYDVFVLDGMALVHGAVEWM